MTIFGLFTKFSQIKCKRKKNKQFPYFAVYFNSCISWFLKYSEEVCVLKTCKISMNVIKEAQQPISDFILNNLFTHWGCMISNLYKMTWPIRICGSLNHYISMHVNKLGFDDIHVLHIFVLSYQLALSTGSWTLDFNLCINLIAIISIF